MEAIKIKGDKVDPSEVENAIEAVSYTKLGKKIMVCHMTLSNGHEVIGMAGVVNPDLFNQEIGEKVSHDKAMDKVWEHLGGLLQNQIAEKAAVYAEVERLRSKGIGNI
jgi:hypothetical protein